MSDIATINDGVKIKEASSLEDKVILLERLFRGKIHGYGKVLKPDDNFYVQTESVDGLWYIATRIFEWLEFDANDLAINYSDEIEPPGLFYAENGTSYIFINSKHRENPFEVAAILAHEIMHYILLTVMGVALEETHDNEQFTDVATINSGLGILVLNGFSYDSGWVETAAAAMFGAIRINTATLSFGYYKPKQYAGMFARYLKDNNIPAEEAAPYFLPATKHFLPISLRASGYSAKKPTYINKSIKNARTKKLAQVGILILVIPMAGLFWWFRAGMNSSSSTPQNQAQVTELSNQRSEVDRCYNELSQLETTVDTTSNASVTNYNNALDTCNGMKDAYNAKVAELNSAD